VADVLPEAVGDLTGDEIGRGYEIGFVEPLGNRLGILLIHDEIKGR